MVRDSELQALIAQAARNLSTLELLIENVQSSGDEILDLQRRVQRLKQAYLRETDALTRQVLKRAIERRAGADRRKGFHTEPVGT
jgi:hypothetical protein